jgi:mRNA-degrading endonuclease toxin of MazEF toxin-antitoxin module
LPLRERTYQPGDIVKVTLDEDRGGRKPRWMLVLSDMEIDEGRRFYLCVAISTTFPEPPPAINVPLPWHPKGIASTGLRKRSAAILDWVRKMPPHAILQREGYIKNMLLKRIYQLLEQFDDGSL